jgi:hypothetical protein
MTQRSGLPLVLLAAFATAPTVLGQGKSGPWEVLIAYDAAAAPKASPRIALRPNVTQPVYVYLRNTGPVDKKNVGVTLVRLGKQGAEERIGQAKIDKLGGKKLEMVRLKPEPPPKVPVPAPPAADGPPFLFQLLIQEAGKEAVRLPLPVTIQQPHEYVQVDPPLYDKKRNRLSVHVEVSADSANPPCPVELVLDPQVVPGLIKPKVGVFKDQLHAKNAEVELVAEQLLFAQGIPPKNGRLYLTVDGYERAAMFKGTFDQGNWRALGDSTRLRVKAPRYFNPAAVDDKPAPKGEPVAVPKIVLQIEADGLLDPEVRLEVAISRAQEERFVVQRLLPGLREQAIALVGGPDGSLLFKTMVRDWRLELDASAGSGRWSVRLRALGAGDNALPLADEQNQKDEAHFLFTRSQTSPYAPLSFDAVARAVFAEIIVDSTGPEGVKLVGLPQQVFPGEKLRLRASAKKRSEAEQARIDKVQFFVGDPAKDPPLAGAFDPTTQLWQADVVVPGDAKNKLGVAVQFTTVTGLWARDSATLVVGERKEPAEATRITGKVLSLFGGKGQPGVDVTLFEKKQAKATAKTDPSGVYVFNDVAPGSYIVSARQAGVAQGVAAVTVEKGKTATADISLKRIN